MNPAWLAALAIGAVQPPAELLEPIRRDTARSVVRARSAQEAFERHRRFQVPISFGGGGRCDERIGRFCYWYDDGDTSLPAEPEPVRASRATLLATLADAQTHRPASDWLVGQRVRYLIEQNLADSAIGVALRCGATDWWCDALGGMALHAGERFAEADSSFARALARMPEPVRCAWTDWTLAWDGRLASRSAAGSCEQRAAVADTAFWLGQPLLARPGNDLRTEFLSRRVMASLHAVARSPHLIPWGRDMEELMLRYGWSTRYSRSEPPAGSTQLPSVIGHQRSPSYAFFPLLDGDDKAAAWRWDLDLERPRSRYAPAYADRFREVDRFQIARFPRGDSTAVFGILDPSVDPALAAKPLDLGLAASPGPDRIVRASRDSVPALEGLTVMVAGQPLVASIETRGRGERQYLRGRVLFEPDDQFGSDDRSVPRLSDPLLFEPGPDLPASLSAAAARALPSGRISRRRPVGVYWELTAAGPDSVAISVAVLPRRRGLVGRLGEGLTVVGRRPPLTLQWRSGPGTGGPEGHAVELDLARLRPGKYLLKLEARTADRTAASVRAVELLP